MEVDQPEPGQELNTAAPPSPPRLAASVILLRGRSASLEVLLVQRNPEARFMGGAWVFPGGAVERGHEGEGDEACRAAGLRELAEEAGVELAGPGALTPFSRWITPALVKTRFDTYFYLAEMPPEGEVRIDGEECVDSRWLTPDDALRAFRSGELLLVFPTIKHLEQLSGFKSAAELLGYAEGRRIEPVEPRVVVSGETARILLPGEPGYDAA